MATPRTRIGETERAAAQLALREHLNAGRLQVNEYVDRSARAANAVTATEVAALFADLSAPHPTPPGSPVGGSRRNLLIVGAVITLAVVTLLAFVIGRSGQKVPAPSPAVVAGPTTSAAPAIDSVNQSTSITLGESAGEGSAAPLPGSTTVRRTTGAVAITLRPSYSLNLDDDTSPNWSVSAGCCGPNDIGLNSDASQVYISDDYAVETGSPGYATCAHETAYTDGAVERGSLKPGENLCVRTSEHRYALVTIVSASDQAIQFRAVVWDPPFSS